MKRAEKIPKKDRIALREPGAGDHWYALIRTPADGSAALWVSVDRIEVADAVAIAGDRLYAKQFQLGGFPEAWSHVLVKKYASKKNHK